MPPRKTHCATLPQSPTTEKTVEPIIEPVYVSRPANKGAPTASIPLLRPPPSSTKRRQPSVKSSSPSEATPAAALKNGCENKPQPASKPEIDSCGEVAWDAMPVLSNHKPAKPNPYELHQNGLQRLYPVLPNPDPVDGFQQSTVVPSAPELDGTLVRQQAKFLQEQMKASMLVENGTDDNLDLVKTNLQNGSEVVCGAGTLLLQILSPLYFVVCRCIQRTGNEYFYAIAKSLSIKDIVNENTLKD